MAEWQQGSWAIRRLDALTARVVALEHQIDELEKWRERLVCAERTADHEPAPWCLPPPAPPK